MNFGVVKRLTIWERSAASAWASSPAPWSPSSWALPTPAIPLVP